VDRYLLFKFGQYYPGGGMKDFEGVFSSVEDAKKYLEEDSWFDFDYEFDHYQIVDRETMKVVEEK
jgi:hypothetical protein